MTQSKNTRFHGIALRSEHLQVELQDAFDKPVSPWHLDDVPAMTDRLDAALGFTRVCRARASQMMPGEQALAAAHILRMKDYSEELIEHTSERWQIDMPRDEWVVLPTAMRAFAETSLALTEIRPYTFDLSRTRRELIRLGSEIENMQAEHEKVQPEEIYLGNVLKIGRASLRVAHREVREYELESKRPAPNARKDSGHDLKL